MWYTDMHVGKTPTLTNTQSKQVQKQITQINGQVTLYKGQMQFVRERSPSEHPEANMWSSASAVLPAHNFHPKHVRHPCRTRSHPTFRKMYHELKLDQEVSDAIPKAQFITP